MTRATFCFKMSATICKNGVSKKVWLFGQYNERVPKSCWIFVVAHLPRVTGIRPASQTRKLPTPWTRAWASPERFEESQESNEWEMHLDAYDLIIFSTNLWCFLEFVTHVKWWVWKKNKDVRTSSPQPWGFRFLTRRRQVANSFSISNGSHRSSARVMPGSLRIAFDVSLDPQIQVQGETKLWKGQS